MFVRISRNVVLGAALLLLPACASAPRRAPAAMPAPVAHAANTPLVAPAGPTMSVTAVPTMVPTQLGEQTLAARIDAFIAQPRFAHASWGIDVVDPLSGRVRYAHNAEKLVVPASNTKLYTTALALATLGGNARFTTTLYATAAPRANGLLAGDLILYGRGDPSLGDAAVAPASLDWADQFAAALTARGVTRISGDLIADDTYYQGTSIGSGWEAGDLQRWYAPRVSALSVQGNVMVVHVTRNGSRCCAVSVVPAVAANIINLTGTSAGEDDPLAIYRPAGSADVYVSGNLPAGAAARQYVLAAPDPAAMAAQLLRAALARHSIHLNGTVRVIHWPRVDSAIARAGVKVMAQIQSPPLRDMVHHTLKHSDNLYAQHFLLQVGVATAHRGVCSDRARAPQTSEQWGLCAMRAMLRRAHIDPGEATFVEGTGLSRKDLVTPAATTSLLVWVSRQPFAADILDALPVAGVDGTLVHRLRDTLAADNLRAKTGTLTHAYALSGYVTGIDGQRLIFSLSLNHYQRPRDALGRSIAPSPDSDLDAIALMLAHCHARDSAAKVAALPGP